jgi:hypothetical protein
MSEATMNQQERAAHLRTWARGAIAKHLNEDHADDLLAREITEIPQKREDQVALHREIHPESAEAEAEADTTAVARAEAPAAPAKPARRTARKAPADRRGTPEEAANVKRLEADRKRIEEVRARQDAKVPEVLKGTGPKSEADHEADQAAAPKPRARKAPAKPATPAATPAASAGKAGTKTAPAGKAPAAKAEANGKAPAAKVPLPQKHATEPAPDAMTGLTEWALEAVFREADPKGYAILAKVPRDLLERYVCVVSKDYRSFQAVRNSR